MKACDAMRNVTLKSHGVESILDGLIGGLLRIKNL